MFDTVFTQDLMYHIADLLKEATTVEYVITFRTVGLGKIYFPLLNESSSSPFTLRVSMCGSGEGKTMRIFRRNPSKLDSRTLVINDPVLVHAASVAASPAFERAGE